MTIEPLVFLPSILLTVAVAASLALGKTLSVWPMDGRILDSRNLQPGRYWLSVGFYAVMAAFSLAGAWLLPPAHPTKASMAGLPPGLIAAIIAVPLGLNIVYYWMKSRAAGMSEWRRFWYVSWLLGLTVLMCPEVFSLSLPSPLWKLALIPVIALVGSAFNVAVSRSGGPGAKS